jgi:PAS domain S-box-containing protein
MPIRELLSTPGLFTEPLALVSSDGTIETSNQQFAEELGLSAKTLAGTRLDALAASSASAISEYLRACMTSAKVVQGSFVLRRRAETIALQARGVAYPPSAAPSASQVLLRLAIRREAPGDASLEDESRRWQEVEDALRRQSQMLEVTLASIGDGVIVTDAKGRATFLNAVAEGLTGWSLQEGRGLALTDIFPIVNEYTRRPVEDPVAKVLESGKVQGLANHTILLAKDGREISIDDSAAPIRLPNGELFGVVLIFRDVTNQRRAELTRRWLASIIESSDDAIVSKTLDGRITSWNPGAVRVFGYSPEEIVGKPITTIVPPELYAEEEEVLARLRRGERVEHFETTRIAKDGRRIEVSLTVSPVRDDSGTIVGASKIARDITASKRAERLLREADRRKDEFLAILAHELRNPLAPMRNAAELLCSGSNPPAAQMACEILQRQLRHVTRLVDDLLDVSRITAGRVDLQIEVIDMEQLLRTVEGALRPSFEAAQQQLTITAPRDPVFAYGDRTRLVQVFSNLLQNAHKYTPQGGSIAVELLRVQSDLVVQVVDTGIGIPPKMLDEIFDLFAQVHPSDQRARGGLGIGLTIAKRLVELHGGRIQARSRGEGQGSEFVVRLPAHAAPRGRTEATLKPAVTVAPRRILIADDNVDAAMSLSMLLGSMGHETRVAYDGVAALEAAEDFRPEIAILDIDMPRLDGHAVAREIAHQPWARDTVLIALTGWGQDSDRTRGREAGFHHHLVKPVEPDALVAVLDQSSPSR